MNVLLGGLDTESLSCLYLKPPTQGKIDNPLPFLNLLTPETVINPKARLFVSENLAFKNLNSAAKERPHYDSAD